ncbi:MAG TPA: 2-oxoglutarate dehydrogenase complex dihydrolipoyllysine-residue succinyltransferase, partial [Pirellulaceae bacterium]|nr:2-oxoglutarate dehydrogenase complex dihydrolipoyllysine-residue succinyltransferase [Pirellulaceae bacterium]
SPSAPSPSASAPSAPAHAPAGSSSVMPAAERLLAEYQISADKVQATGPGGRLLKEDVVRHIEKLGLRPGAKGPAPTAAGMPVAAVASVAPTVSGSPERREEIKPMSMIRRTIASRLVQAQQTAALLTTFNEIDMKPVMELRNRYKDKFGEIHGVKLGFMSFFAKACVEALKRFPSVNSEIRGNDIVTRHYYDIGIAIGGGKGLVVPVLRNVELMSFAQVERQIAEFGLAAKENRIKPADLEGGTFTISNGGVYGSLLSTPIVNPPQSGILGMHSIQERPVAVDGQVVIRPMMYIALTYDHRIIDGREAVGFLRSIKEVLEEPARLFLEV